MPRPWIVRPRPSPAARLRIYCFPYAGGGASAFRTWPDDLPPEVEVCAVQLPGRESRFREAAFSDLRATAAAASEVLSPTLAEPFALFGHSLGSWLAFEFARSLAAMGRVPAHLFVSGRRGPRLPERFPPLHTLPDQEFVEGINSRYGGMAPEVLQNRELLKLLLPSLRADVRAVETYTYVPAPKLECPISVFGGASDAFSNHDELEGWRVETSGPTSLDILPGGHFFIQTQQARLLDLVGERLLRVLPARG